MIKPTVGRVVWFTPSTVNGMGSFVHINPTAPLAAMVTHVWNDRLVNLVAFDSNGAAHSRTSVQLLQDYDLKPEGGYFCAWMPYQVGQAKALLPLPMLTTAAGHPIMEAQMDAQMGYKPGLSFGDAIALLKDGKAVRRSGWNGKGMFIVLMPPLKLPPFNTQGTDRKVNDRTAKWIGEDQPLDCQPYIAMYTAAKQWQPGWLASQADMLANDWAVV